MSRSPSSLGRQRQADLLSTILRAVRNQRRLRASDVAQAMGLAPRTYEHFEAGQGRLDLERLERFAEATDSDPFAILAGLMLRDADLPLRAADNKLLVVMMLALADFNEDLQEDIKLIEARVLVGAFRRVFQDLADYVRKRDVSAEIWLNEGVRRRGLPFSLVRWRAGKS